MRLTKLIAPALVGPALAVAIAFVTGTAAAQTMGEYATATAGVASGGGMAGTSISSPITYGPGGYSGYSGGSRTWATNSSGGSWAERVGSRTGAGATDFPGRAAAASGVEGAESRWPAAQRFASSGDSSSRFSKGSRFSAGSRFSSGSRLGSGQSRWQQGSRFHDNMGIDTNFNSISGN